MSSLVVNSPTLTSTTSPTIIINHPYYQSNINSNININSISNSNQIMNSNNNNIIPPTTSSSTSLSTSTDKFHCVAGSTPFVKAQEKGKVYKEATKRERDFYEMLQNKSPKSPLLQLIPKYYGEHSVNDKDYIILQDLTSSFSKPCIVDIKLGLTHHDIDLDSLIPKELTDMYTSLSHFEMINVLKQRTQMCPQKKSWLKSKYITTPLLGFCLCGYQKYNYVKKEIEKTSKEQGRFLNTSTIESRLSEFFSQNDQLKTEALECVIQKLESFKNYFESNPDFRFRSTSLLIIYESDPNAADSNKCELKMIDFAHARLYPKHIQPYSSQLSDYSPPDDDSSEDDEAMDDEDHSGKLDHQSPTLKHNTTSSSISNDTDNHHHGDQMVESIINDNDSVDSPIPIYKSNSFFPVDGGFLFGVTNLLNILKSLPVKHKLK